MRNGFRASFASSACSTDDMPLFRNNPCISGEVFTQEHPHFNVKEGTKNFIYTDMKEPKKPRKAKAEAARATQEIDSIFADKALTDEQKIEQIKKVMRTSLIEHGLVINKEGKMTLYHGLPDSVTIQINAGCQIIHNHPGGSYFSPADILSLVKSQSMSTTIITKFFEATVQNMGLTLEDYNFIYDSAYSPQMKIQAAMKAELWKTLPACLNKRDASNKILEKDKTIVLKKSMRIWVQLFNSYIRNAKASITLYGK